VAVQWLNQALPEVLLSRKSGQAVVCFYQSLCLVDSEVLRNRYLRVAANRYFNKLHLHFPLCPKYNPHRSITKQGTGEFAKYPRTASAKNLAFLKIKV
jgi:hypothetical protein